MNILQGAGLFFQIISHVNNMNRTSDRPEINHLLAEFPQVFEPASGLPQIVHMTIASQYTKYNIYECMHVPLKI